MTVVLFLSTEKIEKQVLASYYYYYYYFKVEKQFIDSSNFNMQLNLDEYWANSSALLHSRLLSESHEY